MSDSINFLERFAPGVLHDLRRAYPASEAALYSEGVVLGEGEDEDAFLAVTVAMLESTREVADNALVEVTSRLNTARRIETVGHIITLLASGTVVGLTVILESLLGGAISGAIAFLAAAIPIVVNWLRQANIGSATAAENLVAVRESVWDAERLFDQHRAAAIADENRESFITEANVIAKRMFVSLSNLGYHVRR